MNSFRRCVSLSAALGFLLSATFSLPVSAGVVYDEDSAGDLSDDHLAPSNLGLFTDLNTIAGSTQFANSGEVDVFRFNIGAGQRLDSIILREYVSSDNVAFIAINDDVTFPYDTFGLDAVANGMAPANAFLGGSTFGPGNLNVDIMQQMGFITGRGFSGPLGPGDYTIFIQQKGALTEYTFDFNVSAVPEPSAHCLFAAAIPAMLRRRRR